MSTTTALETLKSRFGSLFGRPPAGLVRAPGRVNLIGEHTDYNDGFVLPIAIDRQTLAGWAGRADRRVVFASLQVEAPAEIDLDAPIEKGEPAWANYCRGVAAGLRSAGVPLAGADILFDSDVPIGGGLSSSASLEVATAMALLAAAGAVGKLEGRELAMICQKAEHEYAGAPCGIMDQSISVMGRSGHALLLDCRDGSTRQVPFRDRSLVLLVADTQVKHSISDGGYAARRDQCYAAAARLGVKMLRDASVADVERAGRDGTLEGKELLRASHVVSEIERTVQAVAALDAGDYHAFGRLMYGSHMSLRDDYEVSCQELDSVVDTASHQAGVYGARMTGGGFGGCAIVLAEAARAEAITTAIQNGFERRFGRRCPVFATTAQDGAGVVDSAG